MARYSIIVRKSVSKDLDRIPKKDAQRIIKAIRALSDNPRPLPSKKLSGEEKYRLRCGVYRILYEIQDDRLIICVVSNWFRGQTHRRTACPRPLRSTGNAQL